jgi:hypothetical protein
MNLGTNGGTHVLESGTAAGASNMSVVIMMNQAKVNALAEWHGYSDIPNASYVEDCLSIVTNGTAGSHPATTSLKVYENGVLMTPLTSSTASTLYFNISPITDGSPTVITSYWTASAFTAGSGGACINTLPAVVMAEESAPTTAVNALASFGTDVAF